MYANAEHPSFHQIEYIAVISYVLNLTKPVNLTKTGLKVGLVGIQTYIVRCKMLIIEKTAETKFDIKFVLY